MIKYNQTIIAGGNTYMSNYVLFTDVTVDISEEILKKNDVTAIPMPFFIDDKEYNHYSDFREYGFKGIFKLLRTQAKVTTAQINSERYIEYFEEELKKGNDIVYLCFSSGLSGSIQSANIAKDILAEKYPERKICVVDSLSASCGFGLFVCLAADKKKVTPDIDEFVKWCENSKLHMCHWFTVEDLFFLHRGGRVSKTVAIAGSLLKIMPIMHMDNEGKLILMGKVRGRKAALEALADKCLSTAVDIEKQVIFIGHGDDLESAEYLKEYISKKANPKDIIINEMGPIIGAHSGPGTIGVYFWGTER